MCAWSVDDQANNQYQPETWFDQAQETTSNNVERSQAGWFSGEGLTTYRSINEIDRISNGSQDDSSSVTDSNADSESDKSSQSTEATDLSSDDDAIEARPASRISSHPQLVKDRIVKDAEVHCNIPIKPLTIQNIEVLQKSGGWENITLPQLRAANHDNQDLAAKQHKQQPGFGSKCSRRSSVNHNGVAIPPCKLKRDTEASDCFVTLLIMFATRLITAIWPLSACPPMMSSSFNGAGVLPLRIFIQETLRRSKTSYSTLQVALYYLILLKGNLPNGDFTREQMDSHHCTPATDKPQCRAMQCGRRMFLSALMLASKYLQDRNYSTRAWSKISGLRTAEINENETEYLKSIDYNLHITKESFENWSKIVLTLSRLSKREPDIDMSDNQCLPGLELRPEAYTTNWWNALLAQVDPTIVKSSQTTEDFLQMHIPNKELTELLARFDRSELTTPAAQDSPQSNNYDMNFSEALQLRIAQSQPATPANLTPAASPSTPLSIPTRPQLPNLPTPQTTPRPSEGCHWPQSGKKEPLPLRCAASYEALRNVRKQCLLNASVERCPPPGQRTRSYALPPVRSSMRPAASQRECIGVLAQPCLPSPAASTVSESGACTTRSRASSTSSSSSWSSLVSIPSTDVQSTGETVYSRSSQPHPRSLPLRPVSSNCTYIQDELNNGIPQSPSSFDAVEALMALSSTRPICTRTIQRSMTAPQPEFPTQEQYRIENLPPTRTRSQPSNSPSCGQKRDFVTMNDKLQEQVRQSLSSPATSNEVIDDPLTPNYDEFGRNFQWQLSSKVWASAKKPVSSGHSANNKRTALHCVPQFITAPECASIYLRDDMLTV